MKVKGEEVRQIVTGCEIEADGFTPIWKGTVIFSIKEPILGEIFVCVNKNGTGEMKALNQKQFKVTKWAKPSYITISG